jgi:phage shock protein PspC (stress-responsive transcriptional regulator)
MPLVRFVGHAEQVSSDDRPASAGDEGDPMNAVYSSMRQHGLVRPVQGRMLGGVVAGLGQRFGIGPWPARLLFVLVLMIIPGSQILIYPVLWILMPSEAVSPMPATASVPRM